MAKSHLLQMRGLKHVKAASEKQIDEASHLLQMRGLKHVVAWRHYPLYRRIFYRCVD